MRNTDPVLLVGTVLLVLALIPAIGLVLLYRRVDWRSSRLGPVLVQKSHAIAAVLTLNTIGAVLVIFEIGRPLWFELLRLVAFGWVAVVLWRQLDAFREVVHEALARDARADRADPIHGDQA
jgi:hypothetical protein